MRTPTKAEKKWWDRLAQEIGCIICRNEHATYNSEVSIHHIDGRTKPGCHKKVLPLCFPHHQGHRGIHNPMFGKAVWVRVFGTQEDLRQQCVKILEGK